MVRKSAVALLDDDDALAALADPPEPPAPPAVPPPLAAPLGGAPGDVGAEEAEPVDAADTLSPTLLLMPRTVPADGAFSVVASSAFWAASRALCACSSAAWAV